jgi:hypothetical protein
MLRPVDRVYAEPLAGASSGAKTRTAVLLDAARKVVAFGNEAMEDYMEMDPDTVQKEYLFFDKFKMRLYQQSKLQPQQQQAEVSQPGSMIKVRLTTQAPNARALSPLQVA